MSQADAPPSFFNSQDPVSSDNSDTDLDSHLGSDSDSTISCFQIDLLLGCNDDILGTLVSPPAQYTLDDAKNQFIRCVNEKYGIDHQTVKDALISIRMYPSIRRDNEGMTVISFMLCSLPTSILDGEHTPHLDLATFQNHPTESLFPSETRRGLLLFEMDHLFSNTVKNLVNDKTTNEEVW